MRISNTRSRLLARAAHHRTHRGREGARGMTLLEIMIVIAILGLLASVIVVAVMNQFDRAKTNTAKLKIKSVEQALHQYNVAYGDYPSQGEGLRSLISPPDGGKSFLQESNVPKDPWGNEFLYFNPSRSGKGPFDVISKGEDGQEGTDDDVKSK